ncbi:peptidoglycan DD-metalloendopeptidase family protein [Enterovibrio nigricans]|uniref:Murein DD-endopeptidase MepM and murein hydrolase activator NlpD, contain LysM domain n=1 Tax=Enterovibrio nigricans DSM 22720 TaxID=1121868 RepID=A0A1T4V0A6_9GAMM|nr:peptidoglycan DD-metalloendopeptidase family protein [Enterovibrio nigricans]SKA58355.1 Murein DD-endopeptidase MepM and murein hydrolase activator NlpD, contain LysM domain [Enterovibrio nigricans DSM 22720]
MYEKKTKTMSKLSKSVLGLMGLSLVTVAVSINVMHSDPIRVVPLNIAGSLLPSTFTSDVKVEDVVDLPDYEYTIQSGDSLSQIFMKLGIPYGDLLKLMETDLNHLRIDTLQPNDVLRFWVDKSGKKLLKFELEFNIASKVQYSRLDDDTFEFHEIDIPGNWVQSVTVGDIEGSFSVSARQAGLSYNDIDVITNLLKDKMNFSRDLRAGDKFEVIRAEQFVDGKASGQRDIQAIRIERRGGAITAYLHTDGNYYDKNGDSLQRAFQRYPTAHKERISSRFNPHRKHPVTGRVSPHNGTDFAVRTGTPVLSTGDGVVVMVRNHPYAGKYVVIDHGNQYRTRYLHNSKILVKKGQRVSRGQQIALSGQSGRVTGPHIHYELLIRGRAVNPMTAKIPMATSVPRGEMTGFRKAVAAYDKEMLAAQFK